MDMDIYEAIDSAKAKTFCNSFEEQLESSESLYGENLRFHLSENDLTRILLPEPYYNEYKKKRVHDVLMDRRRKYSYLFV